MLTSSTSVFATNLTDDMQDAGTTISAYVEGADSSLLKATDPEAYATVMSSVKVYDDNHLFSSNVEVWCEARTWLLNYYSGTADGIPDWTLITMCQLWVSNGDTSWVRSPTDYSYNQTSSTATTKVVNASDGGEAEGWGYHTIKDYNGEIAWTDETHDTESF